ncbi:serpentine type 7TM GPCR chemoreceptor srv domain-containing protein [Ditylenchus destructor]|uniref:Serpentine type 7TM GPCR chemoreceptor srv domain-containing protein n=1 Tax=Ditylenchus destructor TaxID=166010 RepID=A0AAD4MZ26_9BILA|nr:serpentine type 7TM GPCR chemoreceptor srv domain-containing protein [Ditylenchus destructor]
MSPEDWTWIQIGAEFPFVLFHISVLACILRCRSRNEPMFKTHFFVFYCLSSIADIWAYIFYSWLWNLWNYDVFYPTTESYFMLRLARIGVTPKFILEYPVGNLVMFCARYCSYFQFVTHTAIAINRYHAIANPVKGKIPKAHIVAIYLIILLLPIPGATTRLLGKIEAKPTKTPNVFVVGYDAAWITVAGSTAFTIYSTITSLISLAFELRTLVIYRGLDLSSRRNRRDDYRLLIYALSQFVTQFLLTCQQILQALTASMGLTQVRLLVQDFYPYLNDLLCLSAPICLIITSRAFRRRYLVVCGLCEEKTVVMTISAVKSF